MSADNWAMCPQCEENAELMKERLDDACASAYGKVTLSAWEELIENARLKKAELDGLRETLREDYGIGFYHGVFEVHYTGHCQVCHWEKKFNYTDEEARERIASRKEMGVER